MLGIVMAKDDIELEEGTTYAYEVLYITDYETLVEYLIADNVGYGSAGAIIRHIETFSGDYSVILGLLKRYRTERY